MKRFLRDLRLVYKFLGFFLLGNLAWALMLARYLLPPRTAETWRRWVFAGLCRAILALWNIHIHTQGKPPKPPYLLVSNHLGYLDVLVLGAQLGCAILAKEEVKKWPWVGALVQVFTPIYIVREDIRALPEVQEKILAAYRRGLGVAFFPEGTSSSGHQVLPFRPALIQCAIQAQAPLHTASLSYRLPAGEIPPSQSVAWWGDMTFFPHLRILLGLPRVDVELRFNTPALQAGDRRQLAQAAWQQVVEHFRATP